MALTRMSKSILFDQRSVLYHVQIQLTRRLHRQMNATTGTLQCWRNNHWRKQIQQLHCRTITHQTRSRDCQTTYPATVCGVGLSSCRASLLRPRQSLPSLLSAVPRRHLNVTVSAPDNLLYIPTPVELSYEFLEYVHESLALPWWATIFITAFLLRSVFVFPFTAGQQRVLARIENVQPKINTHAEHMKQQVALKAKELNWSQKEMANVYSQQVKEIINNLHFEHKCYPRKIFYVGFVQMALWSSVTMAIGQMTGKYPELFSTELDVDYLPELTTQGTLWFSDLTQTDLLIPIMLGVVNLALVEMWSLRRGPLTLLQHRLVNWFRLVAVGMVPIATMMPAALSFFWLSSSLTGLGHFLLLRWPAFRRLINIPSSPSEMKQPLQEMKRAFKIRYFSKRVF